MEVRQRRWAMFSGTLSPWSSARLTEAGPLQASAPSMSTPSPPRARGETRIARRARLLSFESGEAIVDLLAQRRGGGLLQDLAQQLLRVLAVPLLGQEAGLVEERLIPVEAPGAGGV